MLPQVELPSSSAAAWASGSLAVATEISVQSGDGGLNPGLGTGRSFVLAYARLRDSRWSGNNTLI